MLEELGIDHLIGQMQPHRTTEAYLDWMMKHCEIDSFYELNLIQAPCSYVSTHDISLLLRKIKLTVLVGLVSAIPKHLQ